MNEEKIALNPKTKDNNNETYYGTNNGKGDDDENDNVVVDGTTTTTEVIQQHPHHSLLGIFFILLGSFSFSIMFLIVKLMGTNANTFTLVTYRSLVQIVISLITLYYHNENPLGPSTGNTRLWLLCRGFFGSLAVAAWFFGIQILPLPDAVTLQFTTPPFAAAFAVCLVGEKWLLLDIIGAIVCLSGVALIAHPTWLFGPIATTEENDDNDISLFMKALAVMITEGGAAMAGIAYVSVRKIGNDASAVVMVLYYGVISIPICILGSGFMLNEWNVFQSTNFTYYDYFLLLLMGFGGYGGQWFTNLGLQRETAATATLGTTTQIVWTYIFELMFLHESINGWSMAGTGLIVGYMLIVAAIKTLPGGDQGEVEEPLLKEVHAAEEITGSIREPIVVISSRSNNNTEDV